MMVASDVPTATCMRIEGSTLNESNTRNSAGTTTMPPPTPSRPARKPLKTPVATRARASTVNEVGSVIRANGRVKRLWSVLTGGRHVDHRLYRDGRSRGRSVEVAPRQLDMPAQVVQP